MNSVSSTAKRFLDISISAVVLLCAFPVVCATALAVCLFMGRPVLFRQQRPGLHGKPFELIKFRTMTAPKTGECHAGTDTQRLTRLGRFLRALSLDELPTLYNVLKGEMSLVGPRPLLMQYLDRYTPEQARRHSVKPGVTGWAQVNGRNAITWEEKFRHDVWYVNNRTLLLDMKILYLTLIKVIKREGISHGGEATMPEFTGSQASPSGHNKDVYTKDSADP